MQSYFLLVTALLPLVYGYTANKPYPVFSPCEDRVISAIKTHWGVTGFPKNLLKSLDGEVYYISHTSYDYLNENNKCATMEVSGNNMYFTFIRKDNGPNGQLNYTSTETPEGVIIATPVDQTGPEETRTRWYTVAKGNGIVINYICSDISTQKDSTKPPTTVFWVSKKSFENIATKTLLNTYSTFMKSLGFPFKYTYGDECFSSKPSTGTTGLLGLTSLIP